MSYVVGGCNVVAILSMTYGLSCLPYAETVECMSSARSVWYVGVYVML